MAAAVAVATKGLFCDNQPIGIATHGLFCDGVVVVLVKGATPVLDAGGASLLSDRYINDDREIIEFIKVLVHTGFMDGGID